jgi:hypothetical protein
MYRIELGPDDVGVFRSIEEMATAIKTGVITPKARIFHSASEKWLPIEFHPHYKKARDMAAGAAAPPPVPVSAVTHAPVRVGGDAPYRRTPPPVPSPVTGLPLINVSTPPKSAPQAPVAPAAVWPEPVAPEPVAPEPVAPEPVAPEPVAPESLAPEPALPPAPVPVAVRYEPEPEPEPEPAFDPKPVVAHVAHFAPFAHVAPFAHIAPAPVILPLPEPEREAIFLAAEDETPASAADVAEPKPGEPRIAEALPAFQLPRVDLRLGRPRRPILIAAAAVALAGSTHLALSAGRPQWELGVGVGLPLPDLGPQVLRAERAGGPPTNATVLPASVPSSKGSPSFGGASAFSTPKPEVEAPPAPRPADSVRAPAALPQIAPPPNIVIAAPKAGVAPSLEGDLRSAAGLVARYEGAYAAARAELDNGLRTAGFANLFATARLQPAGLRAARASVGTASAYVQRFRRREAEIEQAYRDSFDLLSSRNKWSDGHRRTWEARNVRQEHPEVIKLSSFLLQSLDSLYGLLSAQEAGYRLSDGTIIFDDAAASRAYGELRPWLDRRAHAWADVASDEPTSAARVLRAMGTVKLPEGGSL